MNKAQITRGVWTNTKGRFELTQNQHKYQLQFFRTKQRQERLFFESLDFDLASFDGVAFMSYQSVEKIMLLCPNPRWYFSDGYYYTGAVIKKDLEYRPQALSKNRILTRTEFGIEDTENAENVKISNFMRGSSKGSSKGDWLLHTQYIGGFSLGKRGQVLKSGFGTYRDFSKERVYNEYRRMAALSQALNIQPQIMETTKYEGRWESDICVEYLKLTYANGSIYTGQCSKLGRPHGKGCMVLADGNRLEGTFDNGSFKGDQG